MRLLYGKVGAEVKEDDSSLPVTIYVKHNTSLITTFISAFFQRQEVRREFNKGIAEYKVR
jgi:hypothetical protein